MSTQGILRIAVVAFAALVFAVLLFSQEPAPAATVVPPIIRFQSSAPNRAGDTVEAVFRVYSTSEGGEPLWSETQQVRIAPTGSYSVLLGAVTEGGIPPQLFAAGQALWLGVSLERAPEPPRTLLSSVAYAMKAADADSIGGVPAAQLVTRAQLAALARQVAAQASFTVPVHSDLTGTGTAGIVPMWTSTSALGDSAFYQIGSASGPHVGVNTKSPNATLDVAGTGSFRSKLQLSTLIPATPAAGVSSPMLSLVAASELRSPASSIPQTFAWQVVPVANNTALPSANLNLLYAYNTAAPTPTGFSIGPGGILNFASGQTFPGTIGSITAGTGITVGGSSPNLSISIDPTVVPSLNSGNYFTKAQDIDGGLQVWGAEILNGPFTLNGAANIVAPANTIPLIVTSNDSNAPALLSGGGSVGVQGLGASIGLQGTSAATSFGPNGQGSGVVGNGITGVSGYGSQWGLVGVSSANCCGGVYGTSSNAYGIGLYGLAQSIAVQATGTGAASYGVNAVSPNVGIKTTSTTEAGIALHAIANASSTSTLSKMANIWGPLAGVAVWADSSIPFSNSTMSATALVATAENNAAGSFFNNSITDTVLAWNFGSGSTFEQSVPVIRAGGNNGSCVINSRGDSLCTGAHASAVSVEGGSRQVAMFAVHAPENWFEDFGSAQLADGVATVTIDPAFAETINGAMEYHVFLTPNGDCEGLYVSRKSSTTFEVRELRGGKSNIAFDYRITARRAGEETTRLPDVTATMTSARRPAAQ